MSPYLLSDLKNSQKSESPENTDSKWHAGSEKAPNHFKNAANNNLWKTVDE